MINKETKQNDFKIYCCFSQDGQDVESVIGLIFIDYLNKRLKESKKSC